MLYNPNNPIDKDKARRAFEKLIAGNNLFEMTEKRHRTLSQNAYLHLLLGWFGLETGETLECVKQEIFKALVNREMFEYDRRNPKTGVVKKALRSTSDLTTKEMTDAIERFRDYAIKKCDIYLPAPNEDEYLKSLQVEVEQNKRWL